MRRQLRQTLAQRTLALFTAGALTLATTFAPVTARAASSDSLRQELAAAQETLSGLQQVLDQAEAELGKTNWELDQTRTEITELEAEIEDTKAELVVARDRLATVVQNAYKQGKPSLIDLILGSNSFDELFSRIYYANKVSASQKEAIETVCELQASLETDQIALVQHEQDLEELLSSQQEQQRAAESAAASQAAYIGQLSDELVAALEAERIAAAEASRKAAEEAAQREAEEQAAQQTEQTTQQSDGQAQEEQSQAPAQTQETVQVSEPNPEPTPVETTDDSSSSGGSSSYSGTSSDYYYSGSGSARDIAVSAALSQVGKAYGHDNNGYNWDCNGLTHWAWAQAGVYIPESSGHYSYGQFQWMKSSGRWVTSTSQMSPGDLVFFSYDGGITTYHVAMYVGGGMVVHALSYSQGVQVTPIDWCDGFCGGGSPI